MYIHTYSYNVSKDPDELVRNGDSGGARSVTTSSPTDAFPVFNIIFSGIAGRGFVESFCNNGAVVVHVAEEEEEDVGEGHEDEEEEDTSSICWCNV